MSSGQLSRAWEVLEALFNYPEGRSLGDLAAQTGQPKAALFRDLREFTALGLVRQDETTQRYLLTYRLVSMSLRHMASTGVHDAAQPILDRLARSVGELVRLAVVDGDSLVYVAWAQGRRTGLRYEPVNGDIAPLFCTATGHAFLAALPDDQAMRCLAAQPPAAADGFGRNAPRGLAAAQKKVREARARGHGYVVDSFSEGMTAVAAAIRAADGSVFGVVSIAVPTALCDSARGAELGRHAVAAAAEMAEVWQISRHFRPAPSALPGPAPAKKRAAAR